MRMKKNVLSLQIAIVFLFVSMFGVINNVSVSAVESVDGLVAYYSFDENFNDASSNSNNGTMVGNVTHVDGIKGKGAAFDGQSYIEVASNSSFELKKSFSYSYWVRTKSPADNSRKYYPIIFKSIDDSKNYAYTMGLNYYNYFSPYNDFEGGGIECKYDTPVDRDKWTFVSATWDGQDMKFYIDGKFKGNKSMNKELRQGAGKIYLGYDGKYYYSGILDELRLYNRVLNQEEITSMYDSIYKQSYLRMLENKQVAFYTFDGNLDDMSGFVNNGTIVGSGISYAEGVAGTGGKKDAINFNGNGYIEVKDNDSLDLDKAFTFATWVKPKDDPSSVRQSYGVFHKIRNKSAAYGLHIEKVFNKDIYQTTILTEVQNREYELTSTKTGIKNNWIFLSMVFDGNKLTYYLNGVPQDNKNDISGKAVSHSSDSLIIGADSQGKNQFKGSMDELRIYNYAMTSKEISALYSERNMLSIKLPDNIKGKETLNIKILFKPLRGEEQDVTNNAVVIIDSKNAKLLKYNKGALTGVGRGMANFTVKYNNISTTYKLKIQ